MNSGGSAPADMGGEPPTSQPIYKDTGPVYIVIHLMNGCAHGSDSHEIMARGSRPTSLLLFVRFDLRATMVVSFTGRTTSIMISVRRCQCLMRHVGSSWTVKGAMCLVGAGADDGLCK